LDRKNLDVGIPLFVKHHPLVPSSLRRGPRGGSKFFPPIKVYTGSGKSNLILWASFYSFLSLASEKEERH
jgi:hypothetical protein